MSFWRRLFGRGHSEGLKPQRLDYLNEALALERQGDFEGALTSYRLALRDNGNDPRILQNMAIAFTKTGQYEEAVRHYRRALYERIRELEAVTFIAPARAISVDRSDAGVEVLLEGGARVLARLAVGAEGRTSRLREGNDPVDVGGPVDHLPDSRG